MKKTIIFTLFLVVIDILVLQKVSAATNPYNEQGPYGTNCTWYTWNKVLEKSGVSLPAFGDAKDWYNDAKNAGYTVGTIPQANSIIVWGNWTYYGHVGYVESINGNKMYIWDSSTRCIDKEEQEFNNCMANSVSEETDKICYANAKEIACEYTINPDEYGVTGYIYLNYAPKSSPAPATTTPKVEIEKSNNTNLSSITISARNINFDKENLKYSLEVEYEIETINVNATVEDETSKISGTGNYKLNIGLNEIKLLVTAEDGSTKEYVINITRKDKQKVEQQIEITETKKDIKSNDNNQIIILKISIILLAIIGILLIFYRKRKLRK